MSRPGATAVAVAACVASGLAAAGCLGSQPADPLEPLRGECPALRPTRPDPAPGPPGPDPASFALYADNAIVDLHLQIRAAAWDRLLEDYARKRKNVVPVHFEWGGRRFENAGVRLKGTADRWEVGHKMQFVVRFDYYGSAPLDRFRGLRRINLDHEGVAPIRNNLGMALLRRAGGPASRTNWARLSITVPDAPAGGGYPHGYYGLYENIEVVDDVFLEGRFADPSGTLYKGIDQLESGDEGLGWCDLDALLTLADDEPLEGDHATFFAALEAIADVPALVRFLAAEAVVALGDNFWAGGDNFYLYNDPQQGFVPIPWDVDDVFSEVSPSEADLFRFHGTVRVGALPNRLWLLVQQHPGWRQAFLDEVERLRVEVLPALAERIPLWCDLVRPDVALDTTRRFTMAEFDQDCSAMAARWSERDAWLARVLPGGGVAP